MNVRHGMAHTRLYRIWLGMKTRCGNPKHPHYNDYGGRGIAVCEEWKNSSKSFCDWAMSNGYTEELTLDRVDVNGDYCPDNCRWATMKDQHSNRRDTIMIAYNGKTQSLAKWAAETGIDYHKLFMRISRGWSAERAFTKR